MTDESKQDETKSLGSDSDFVEQALDRMEQAGKRAGTPAAPDRVGPTRFSNCWAKAGWVLSIWLSRPSRCGGGWR